MSDDDATFMADLRRRLNRHGLRLTPQREAIWRLYAASPRGYTLPEACRALSMRSETPVGQATVYRVVNALHALGYLRFVHDPDGEHRYLAGRPGHVHHLVCRACGSAREVRDCDLSTLQKLLATQTGFIVEGHHLEFFGLCPDCGPLPDLRVKEALT
jgi:Fe2+ or Zn2+ uptake regulation protein